MFSKSDLSKIGEKFIFIVFNNLLYNLGNASSAPSADFLIFAGKKFPLYPFLDIRELERRYQEKIAKEIKEFKRGHAKREKIDGDAILKEMEINEFLRFYLFSVQKYYAEDIAKKLGLGTAVLKAETETKSSGFITGTILASYNGNFAVLNRRIYSLNPNGKASELSVTINKQAYHLLEPKLTLPEFETAFQATLEAKLKAEVLTEISSLKEQQKEMSQIENLLALEGMRKNQASYEYKNLGFDTTSNFIYWLPASRSNGREAVGTALTRNESGVAIASPVTRTMMYRDNRDSPFRIKDVPCIVINVPDASNTMAVINYLKECANTKFPK